MKLPDHTQELDFIAPPNGRPMRNCHTCIYKSPQYHICMAPVPPWVAHMADWLNTMREEKFGEDADDVTYSLMHQVPGKCDVYAPRLLPKPRQRKRNDE